MDSRLDRIKWEVNYQQNTDPSFRFLGEDVKLLLDAVETAKLYLAEGKPLEFNFRAALARLDEMEVE